MKMEVVKGNQKPCFEDSLARSLLVLVLESQILVSIKEYEPKRPFGEAIIPSLQIPLTLEEPTMAAQYLFWLD